MDTSNQLWSVGTVGAVIAAFLMVGCAPDQRMPDEQEGTVELPADSFKRWAGADEEITEDEFQKAAEGLELYERWERDGDGEIDSTEFASSVFQVWDRNNNNRLSESEWTQTHRAWYQPGQRHGAFEDWDADDDGTLSEKEVVAGVRETNLFQFWDHDDSTAISRTEFVEHAYDVWDRDDDDVIDEEDWNTAVEPWTEMEKGEEVQRVSAVE